MTECSADPPVRVFAAISPTARTRVSVATQSWPHSLLKGTAWLDRSAGARYGGQVVFFSGNRRMTGIQFVTDEKGRRTAVLVDLRKHRAIWEDFWDGLVSESRRKQKGISYEEYRAKRLKHNGRRG